MGNNFILFTNLGRQSVW